MARGRFISKSLGSSEKFAKLGQEAGKLGEFAQSLYPLLVSNADDFGRLCGDAFTVKHRYFSTSSRKQTEFDVVLDVMNKIGIIQRYSVDSLQVIQVVVFEEHQTGLHKRSKSYFPELPGNSGEIGGFPPNINSKLNQNLNHNLNQEVKACAAPAKHADPPQDSGSDVVVMVFPTSGKPSTWPLLQSKLDEYHETYSALDVVRECKQARQWCVDNESNRKTANGMLRFLNRWLAKAQNEPGNKSGRFRSRTVEPDPARSYNDLTCICCKVPFVPGELGSFKMGCKCKPLQWCEEHLKCENCCGCQTKKLQNSS